MKKTVKKIGKAFGNEVLDLKITVKGVLKHEAKPAVKSFLKAMATKAGVKKAKYSKKNIKQIKSSLGY